jgi:hypothetical protein
MNFQVSTNADGKLSYTPCYKYVKLNNMGYLVRLKNSDKSFYVKMKKSFEFGIPSGHWIGVEDEKIYHSDDLVFLQGV